MSAGAFIGSLVAVTVLVAPPVMLLGAVSPYAIRLAVERVEESGTVAGRMYAISTIGSLAGTFASALLLIPLVGTRRTFLVFGLACALVAVTGLARRAALAVPAAIVALLALPVGTIKATSDGAVLEEVETEYQYARVVEEPDGERKLELNEGQAVHSLYRPGSYLTGDYWDEFLVLPFAARPTPPRAVAILGNAAGTTARALGRYFPDTSVDAVEIDSELTELGRRWFDLRNPRMRVHHEDARPYLRRTSATLRRDHGRRLSPALHPVLPGDARVLRAGARPPEPGRRRDRERRPSRGPGRPREGAVGARWRTCSRPCCAIRARTPTRRCSAPRAPHRRRGCAARCRACRPICGRWRRLRPARLAPALEGGAVYTDDRAPVEWLIDKSIVDYAARRGVARQPEGEHMNADGRRRFEGRVVVVTGGASGLGEAMSHGFAREGGRVAVLDLREEGAAKVAEAADGEARGYACDVSPTPRWCGRSSSAWPSDLGDVEVLVNNAGIARRNQETQDRMLEQVQAAMTGGERESLGATAELSDEEWDRMIRVHLYGTFHCTREALKMMEPTARGAILNISSVAALQGLPGAPDYSAAKAGIIGITRSVAQEVPAPGSA